MSMNSCFICGKVYDTDFEMEADNEGNMICDNCFGELEAKAQMEYKRQKDEGWFDGQKVLCFLLSAR